MKFIILRVRHYYFACLVILKFVANLKFLILSVRHFNFKCLVIVGKHNNSSNFFCLKIKKTRPKNLVFVVFEVVPRLGIEPRTQGFSVPCSTN